MIHIKVYGMAEYLNPLKVQLSDAIHRSIERAWLIPPLLRFHRFFPMDPSDFLFPTDRYYRYDRYIIIEISILEGRSPESKRRLIRFLFDEISWECGISPDDLEIILQELPRSHWAFRGKPADEQELPYRIEG